MTNRKSTEEFDTSPLLQATSDSLTQPADFILDSPSKIAQLVPVAIAQRLKKTVLRQFAENISDTHEAITQQFNNAFALFQRYNPSYLIGDLNEARYSEQILEGLLEEGKKVTVNRWGGYGPIMTFSVVNGENSSPFSASRDGYSFKHILDDVITLQLLSHDIRALLGVDLWAELSERIRDLKRLGLDTVSHLDEIEKTFPTLPLRIQTLLVAFHSTGIPLHTIEGALAFTKPTWSQQHH